jgi:hypothetical protein
LNKDRLCHSRRAKGAVMAERMIAAAAKQYGFAREDVLAAAGHWNLIEEQRDGTVWWRKPEVLTCLPNWNYRPDGPRRAA